MAPVLNRTPLACIAFDDGNGKHLRVYYQDVQGTIKESFYDDGSGWTTRAPGDVVGKGRLNTGISACCWANGTQVRASPSAHTIAPSLTRPRSASTSLARTATSLRYAIYIPAPHSDLDCELTMMDSACTPVARPGRTVP